MCCCKVCGFVGLSLLQSFVFFVAILTIGEFVCYSFYIFPNFENIGDSLNIPLMSSIKSGLVFHIAGQATSGIYVASSAILITGLFFNNYKLIRFFMVLVTMHLGVLLSYAMLIYFKGRPLPCEHHLVSLKGCFQTLCEQNPTATFAVVMAMVVYKGLHICLLYAYVIRNELSIMTRKARDQFLNEIRETAYNP